MAFYADATHTAGFYFHQVWGADKPNGYEPVPAR